MNTESLTFTLVLAWAAGLSIPVGALISANKTLRDHCVENELDSLVSYFGGGALMAAVALVLVPFGMEHNSVIPAAAAFLTGGLVFWLFNLWMKKSQNSMTQFAAMLSDFIPEGIALGAAAATGSGTSLLLALLIALQNIPEGFAAFHEMRSSSTSTAAKKLWPFFILASLAGPLAAWFGYTCLASNDGILGLIMLFCSGGILYLIFDDIAPGAHVKNEHFPATAAILGFLLGMIGTMLIH